MALVGDVHQHPGEELQRVHGLGPCRRALGLIERYAISFSARSYVSRSKATGLRGQYDASWVAKARLSSGTQTAVCTWNPECGHVSMPAA